MHRYGQPESGRIPMQARLCSLSLPGNHSTSTNSKMPMGVFLTTNINAKSGNFYTITTGKLNREGNQVDRPNGLGKNTEVAPHYFDVSFNITKSFPLHHLTGALPQRRTPANT